MITAKQRWIQFEEKNGRAPTLEEWESWGYHKRYYYQVRKQVQKEALKNE